MRKLSRCCLVLSLPCCAPLQAEGSKRPRSPSAPAGKALCVLCAMAVHVCAPRRCALCART